MTKYIAIEGTDGSGKATTSAEIARVLKKKGYTVEIVSFPMYDKWHSYLVRNHLNNKNGGLFGDNPYMVSLIYALDRACWAFGYRFKKKPDYIIFDRYATSNMVYQSMKIHGPKSKQKLIRFIKFLEYGLFRIPKPDRVFMLDLPVAITMDRLGKRESQDRYENTETQERARVSLLQVGGWLGWIRIPTSSSDGEPFSKEMIARMIIGPVKPKTTEE